MVQRGVRRLLARFSISDQPRQATDPQSEVVVGSLPRTVNSRSSHRLPELLSNFESKDLNRLVQETQDYEIVHGGLLKAVLQQPDRPCASAWVVGISLHPSPFPRTLFEEACQLQALFHELYVAISNNSEWLREVLRDIITADPLIRTLWSVFEAAKTRKDRRNDEISAGILRSDYMVHAGFEGGLQLKQVELNTIACAGAAHGQRVAAMHRHLQETGSYSSLLGEDLSDERGSKQLDIPMNENTSGISRALATAHNAYLRQRPVIHTDKLSKTCVLMIVQPINFNIADERPIEYALWSCKPSIPCFRLEWAKHMLEVTSTSPSGALLFHPPHLSDVHEVSVVYFRAGFEPHEFVEQFGYEARLRFETSPAVKCPDILTHLAGSKKVQQALCIPGTLERFIDAEKAERLRRSFMPMYPLDVSELGNEGRKIATNPDLAKHYVLKPSREGGGHNIYREDICSFLLQLPEHRWTEYILMEMIEPAVAPNALVSSRGVYMGETIAELGIWGGYVWQKGDEDGDFLSNEQIGWSVRTKNPQVDEMSVVKGYGCFDSIALI